MNETVLVSKQQQKNLNLGFLEKESDDHVTLSTQKHCFYKFTEVVKLVIFYVVSEG